MIRSFSIIVPVYNCESVVVRTLRSIEDSIQFFYEHADPERSITSEIVLINDGSSDNSSAVIREFIQNKPYYKLLEHTKSLGAGPARNVGVKIASGEVIFFMDGDDLFYKEHVYVCLKIIGHQPQAGGPESFEIPTSNPPLSLAFPKQPVGIVKTGIATQDKLHPYWKAAIENGAPINFCLWKACHDFVEGYPESAVYKRIGREDIPYYSWLLKFFKIGRVNLETTEYIRYPHNNLQRQLQKFQTPPEQCPPEPVTPEEQELHLIANQLEEERLRYLYDKIGRLGCDSFPVSWMNWQNLAQELLNQQKYPPVLFLCEKFCQENPEDASQASQLLAIAYNNLGSRYQQQGNLGEAAQFFEKALRVNAPLPPADLARIYYNAATVLKSQNNRSQALDYFQSALSLHADFPQAAAELCHLQYSDQIQQRGYQFSEDAFSQQVSVWQQVLNRFVDQPKLQALEVGGREGRVTCWMLDNLLIHESARLTCIHTGAGTVEHPGTDDATLLKPMEQRFDDNVARTGSSTKVTKLVGPARKLLRSQPLDVYDLAYVAGSHIAAEVLEEALLVWSLVKVGGILIFDDYGFQVQRGIDEQPPKAAIDAFLAIYSKKIKILHQGYQIMLEKMRA